MARRPWRDRRNGGLKSRGFSSCIVGLLGCEPPVRGRERRRGRHLSGQNFDAANDGLWPVVRNASPPRSRHLPRSGLPGREQSTHSGHLAKSALRALNFTIAAKFTAVAIGQRITRRGNWQTDYICISPTRSAFTQSEPEAGFRERPKAASQSDPPTEGKRPLTHQFRIGNYCLTMAGGSQVSSRIEG